MISSDLPEIISMSDRIYVMRLGAISAEVPGEGATEQSILTRMLPDKTAADTRDATAPGAGAGAGIG
jgi:ABC-type dipeptide/oligopeptide/nickel transport system ATPase subunit